MVGVDDWPKRPPVAGADAPAAAPPPKLKAGGLAAEGAEAAVAPPKENLGASPAGFGGLKLNAMVPDWWWSLVLDCQRVRWEVRFSGKQRGESRHNQRCCSACSARAACEIATAWTWL